MKTEGGQNLYKSNHKDKVFCRQVSQVSPYIHYTVLRHKYGPGQYQK
jgi:hypothetical protein